MVHAEEISFSSLQHLELVTTHITILSAFFKCYTAIRADLEEQNTELLGTERCF